jgi:hypothetical protein
VRVIAHVAVFLEFADDATLDADAAVQQLEDMASQLQQLAPTERSQFIRLLDEVAQDWPSEQQRHYLHDLPAAIGIA